MLTLEAALGSELPAGVIEELFRSFHSLKSISAMVELREAELLAHQMESCLRAIGDGHLTLTSATFETLVDGARVLENVILTRRSGEPPPAVASFLERLKALAPQTTAPATRRSSATLAETSATESRAPRWKVTFDPSPDLVARGVKVDVVRTRLQQIGHVLNVTPKVVGGGIAFEFEIATDHEEQLAKWRDDAIT